MIFEGPWNATRSGRVFNRRAWFSAISSAAACSAVARADQPKKTTGKAKDDSRERSADRETEEIESIARQNGLGRFRATKTAHYLTIGDADPSFRLQAGKLCEALARDYLGHFRKLGFSIEAPKRLLTLVTLADSKGFRVFTGLDSGTTAGGVYNLESNRLFVFDFRNTDIVADAARTNSMALFHEAMHQLTYNTGLLRRDRDVPVFISEGFATYGEVRRPNGREKIGDLNVRRLAVLLKNLGSRDAWIPVRDLIGDDRIITGDRADRAAEAAPAAVEDRLQTAYAESWLTIYHALRTDARRRALRAYLEAIKTRKSAEFRLEDARKHLGDLDRLDDELREFAARSASR